MSLVLLTFAKLRRWREAEVVVPRVVMISEQEGVMLFPSHTYPYTKRHSNNTKTDNLPILIKLRAFQGRTITSDGENHNTNANEALGLQLG